MKSPLAGNPEFVPEWDVLRDEAGNPVTITAQQMQAIWRAVRVVNAVRQQNGMRSLWEGPPEAEMAKSRLLGRMLLYGLPPTRTRPPVAFSGPDWGLLPDGDPFQEMP